MIPKIIHQIWIGENPIPRDLRYYCRLVKISHPDWEYKFWTNKNCEELVSELTDSGKQFYQEMIAAKKWAWACDVLRIAAVYKYGGIYLDCDFKMMKDKTFNELPLENNLLLSNKSRSPNPANLVRLQNCIFSAIPKHDFIEHLLKKIRNVPYQLTTCRFAPLEQYNCQYFTTEYFLRLYPNDVIGLPKHFFVVEEEFKKNKEIIMTGDWFYGKRPMICKHLYRLSHIKNST